MSRKPCIIRIQLYTISYLLSFSHHLHLWNLIFIALGLFRKKYTHPNTPIISRNGLKYFMAKDNIIFYVNRNYTNLLANYFITCWFLWKISRILERKIILSFVFRYWGAFTKFRILFYNRIIVLQQIMKHVVNLQTHLWKSSQVVLQQG